METSNKIDYIKISSEINYDIEKGVYDSFIKLKGRLSCISKRLLYCAYTINGELAQKDINTLERTGYLY